MIHRLAIFLLISQSAFSAGFDCKKASSTIEKNICADPYISISDESMSNYYKKLRLCLPPGEFDLIKHEQRQWIKNVRNACTTNECLKNAYSKRIKALNYKWHDIEKLSFGEDGSTSLWFWKVYDTQTITKSFNATGSIYYFKKHGIDKVKSCDLGVYMPFKINQSFGGLCLIEKQGKTSKAMVCNDTAIGHFRIEENSGEKQSLIGVASFTYNNCFGG